MKYEVIEHGSEEWVVSRSGEEIGWFASERVARGVCELLEIQVEAQKGWTSFIDPGECVNITVVDRNLWHRLLEVKL